MTRTFRNILLPIFALILSLQVGCASTPAGKYNEMNEAFIAAVDTANTARAAGQIDDETWEEAKDVINEGNDVLNQMYEELQAGGDPTRFEFLLDVALIKLQGYVKDLE